MRKLRVALFTPLPPSKTGTADYGAALAAELEKLVALSVYEKIPFGFDPTPFDHVIYQIGNNPFHAGIYNLALEHPGIVVLHEASVHYLVRSLTLSRGNRKGYIKEVRYELFGDDLGRFSGRYLPFETPQPHEFLMVRRLLDRAQGCIVHNRYAERLVRLKRFNGPVAVVPHGAQVGSPDGLEYRRRMGLEPETPIVAVFGYQRPDKQIWESLMTFAGLAGAVPDARLLILGEPHPQVPIAEGIRDFGLNGRVIALGYQSIEDFDGYLAASNVVLNLRQSTFGESSGTMMRAFGMGKPVLVSNVGSVHDLPDDVCFRIPRDRHEMAVIRECLKWVLEHPSEAAEVGENARDWVARECTWAHTARAYAEFLDRSARESVPRTAPPVVRRGALIKESIERYLSRWIDRQSPAAAYYDAHSVRLVRTLQLTPPGEDGSRVLELGCYMQITPALRELLGYREVRGAYMGPAGGWHRSSITATDGDTFTCRIDLFNCEVDRFPYPDEHFDTVLCCELLEHLAKDPMHMMTEIHRILKPNGTLVLTTPNAVSIRALRAILLGIHPALFSKYVMPTLLPEAKHFKEYTPKELMRLFSDAGFSLDTIETTPYGPRPGIYAKITEGIRLLRAFTRLREDCVYLVGRKAAPAGTRYPSWLYEQA